MSSTIENRSISHMMQDDSGRPVFSCNATYRPGGVNASFNANDAAYCAAHPEEVQAAVTGFLAALNAELRKDGGFIIQ